jgi:hypothetical protein
MRSAAFAGTVRPPLRRGDGEHLATRCARARPRQRTTPPPTAPLSCADAIPTPPPPWAERVAQLFPRTADAGARAHAFAAQPRVYVAVRPLLAAEDAAWLAPSTVDRHYGGAGRASALRTPLPTRRGALDRVLFEEAVERTRRATPQAPSPRPPCLAASDAAMLLLSAREFVAALHPRGRRARDAPFGVGSSDVAAECVAAAASGAFPTALDLFTRLCQAANRAVLCASIEEVETLDDDDSLSVAGYLYVTGIRRLYGEDVPEGTAVQVKCPSPAFAAAVSTALNISCFVPRYA